MKKPNELIRRIDFNTINVNNFEQSYVSCLVLTFDHKILLQQRALDWEHFPGYLSTFGGRIEINETPVQALIRELNEELGARVVESDMISFGALTEAATQHQDLIYEFFWHDTQNTITGCYEGEARYFENTIEVLKHPKIVDDVKWLLEECKIRKLL